MRNPFRRLGHAVKAAAGRIATTMRFPSQRRYSWATLGATHQDFREAVGDPGTNSLMVAIIKWQQRVFPEAPMVVRLRQANGDEPKKLADHPLAQLLDRPNPVYSGLLLWSATIADFTLSGNAYWRKIRSAGGRVVQLWWVPSYMLEPRWPDDGSAFISHYDYTVDGQIYHIDRDDIVHFPDGMDPANPRKGLSGIVSLMREIGTDNEAANYTASLLRNMGVPGALIAPDGTAILTPDDAEEIKAGFQQRFSGDRRGEPMVMSTAAKVTAFGFDPKQMDVAMLRRIPEERISAVLGIPAIVVGFGAGLARSTFANFSEAREAAYESNVIPTQRLFAAQVQTQLVPDFGDPASLFVEHDYANVRVLQANVDDVHKRAREDLLAGGITVNQFLARIGEKPLPDVNGDVVYMPVGVTPLLVTDLLAQRLLPARTTIQDPNAALPSPTVDPNDPNPQRPGDTGAIGAPKQPLQLAAPKALRDALGKAFDPEMAAAVLAILGEKPPEVDAVAHAELVLREARAMRERNGSR